MWRVSIPFLFISTTFGLACDRWEDAQPGRMNPPVSRESPPAKNSSENAEYDLAKLESEFKGAKARFEADPTAKTQYVEATVRFADALNYGPGDPKQKYPAALALYEQVLEIAPENEAARKGRQIILDVYKSMGMEPRKLE